MIQYSTSVHFSGLWACVRDSVSELYFTNERINKDSKKRIAILGSARPNIQILHKVPGEFFYCTVCKPNYVADPVQYLGP